jgi:hypothetical protein
MQVYIESIDINTGTMIVEYTDPYGLQNIRLGVKLEYPITQDDIISKIKLNAPITQFEEYKNIQPEIQNQANIDYIKNIVGTTLDIDMLVGFKDVVY